ncbi:MAG: hypothetical protein K8I03_09695 [Ignavibacteria bacterium]|nr:hypothetical protein [Ignavibacteria bacterium]
MIKYIFNIKEIDPVINSFTENSDKQEIKLFGGDLNFFGNGPGEMDLNKQYICLKSLGFNKVLILCSEPQNTTDNIRYGKILNDFKNVEIRYYDPKKADLFIRGRLKTIQGVTKLLIYTKVKKGLYRIIETDTANSNGALYNNIWELAWGLARKLSTTEISSLSRL